MRKLIFLLIFAFATPPAAAAKGEMFDTGNILYQYCNDPNSRNICTATIVGHYDMMIALGYECKGDSGVTKGQIADVVIKYMTEHPAERHLAAAYLSVFAMQAAFSCKRMPAAKTQ